LEEICSQPKVKGKKYEKSPGDKGRGIKMQIRRSRKSRSKRKLGEATNEKINLVLKFSQL
jgi:CobQ-like glutamine amidotransferase family enzyme